MISVHHRKVFHLSLIGIVILILSVFNFSFFSFLETVKAATQSWTSQSDWEGGTRSNVDTTTSAGNLLLSSSAGGAQSISFRAASSANNNTIVNKPSGVVNGDVMVAAVSVTATFGSIDTTTITPPSGWTLIRRTNNSSEGIGVATYYKVASSEPSTYQFSLSGGSPVIGVFAYSGVDTSDPINAENGQTTSAGTSHATPSITTTVANAQIITNFAVGDGRAVLSAPSGETQRYAEAFGTSIHISAAGYDQSQAAAGSTGAKTAGSDMSVAGVNHILALKPGSGGTTYSSSGTDVTQYNSGSSGTTWSAISWNGSTPASTTIKARARAASSQGGLSSATWSSYVTTSGGSVSLTGQWVEVEWNLSTSDTSVTPTLNDGTVTYSLASSSSTPSPSPSSSSSSSSSGSGSSTGSGSSSSSGSGSSTGSTGSTGGTSTGTPVVIKVAKDSCTTIIKDIVLSAQDKSARLTFNMTQSRGAAVFRYDNARAKNKTSPAVGYDTNSIASGNNQLLLNHDFTLENLIPLTTYYYTIVATNTGGYSTKVPSCEYSFTTTSPPATSLTTLTGNVYLDGTTTPIPNVKIFFHRLSPDSTRWVASQSTLTDAKGSFAFEYSPTDSYFVGIDPIMTEQGYHFGFTKPTSSCSATQNGLFGFTWRNGLTLPTDGCRVVIYMTKIPDSYPTMSGKLLEDGTTKGVSKTRIQMFSIGAGGSALLGQTKTDEQGGWSLKYPPNTPIQVQAITDTSRLAGPTKPVYGCKGDALASTNILRWQKTILPSAGCANNIFYITVPHLATGPVLSGKVMDSVNNKPINDVRVLLYSIVDGKEVYATQIYTNSVGYWRFVTKPNTAYRAYAYFDIGHTLGYLNGPQIATASCQHTNARTVSIEFASVPATDCLDVTFYARPLDIAGNKVLSGHTVNDLTQAPVGKISIRLAALQTELNSWRVVDDGFTDNQGKWQFSVIPGVKYLVETRYTPGWLHGFKQPIAGCKTDNTFFYRLTWRTNLLKENCTSNIFYMMPADGKITGKITLADGQTGIPNSLQRLWYTVKTNNELLQYTNSDSQGRYSFDCRKGVGQYKLKQDPSWQFTGFDAYIDTNKTTSRKISNQPRETYIPVLASECRESEPVNLAVTITPTGGTFEKEVKGVTMAYTSSIANHKAEIHYTVNGSRPTITSPLYRDKPLAIGRLQQQAGTQQVVLRAVAFGSESEQAEATYLLTAPPTPSPSPSASATVSPKTSPSPTSAASPSPSTSPSTSPSPQVVVATLDVTAQPAGDRYSEPVTVSLRASESSSDVTILYTTDGSDPRDGGKTYTAPISFNSTVTLNYVARKTSTGQTTELKTDIYTFPITVNTIIRWDPTTPGAEPTYTITCNEKVIATTTETSYLNPLQQLDGCVYGVTAKGKDGTDHGLVKGISVESANPISLDDLTKALPIASTVAAAGAAIAVVSARPEVAQTLRSIPFFIQTLWLTLLALLGIRKRHKNWGGVYETVLDSSIAGAIVSFYRVLDGKKELIDRQLADKNGNYGFLIAEGQYQIDVKKTGYVFPSHVSPSIYNGTPFSISNQEKMHLDLFMDPFELSQRNLMYWRKLRSLVEKLNLPLLIAGTAMTAYDLTKNGAPFTLAVAAVYAGLWIDKIVRLRRGSLEQHR